MNAPLLHTRYSRQEVLKEIGKPGQRKLGSATAVILGLGGLGSSSAGLLARAGVGTLRLVDRDLVDCTNLQRQCLFDEEDATRSLPKAEAAKRHLQQINSSIRCEPVTDDINVTTVERIVAGASVVVDGLDNFHTRALVNEACVKHGIPWVYGSCLGTFGSVATIIPGVTACLHCLLPEVGEAATPPLTCETVGVLGPIAALIAAWQSAEALKILVGQGDAIADHLINVDLWHNEVSPLPFRRAPDCGVCVRHDFNLLGQGDRLATTSLCGRNAVQVMPPAGLSLDFDLLSQTLGRLFEVERNQYLLRFRVGSNDIVVFHGGRAIVFGTSDPKIALSLYGKYIGG